MVKWVVLIAACLGASPLGALETKPVKAADFRLADHQGNSHALSRQTLSKCVVIVAAAGEGSLSQAETAGWSELTAKFSAQPVKFWILNSGPDWSAASLQKLAEGKITSPLLKDAHKLVSRSLELQRVGEVMVVETQNGEVRYRGALADTKELENAVTQILEGQPVTARKIASQGKKIDNLPATKPISYSREIAPLLAEHCVQCHSPGNIGPFAFTSYERVRGWASTIRETALTQRMPPWHADGRFGKFSNDCSLTPDETRLLVDWIDQGARSDGPDPLAKPLPTPEEGWVLGKPDHIVSMPKTLFIPETGVFPYQYYSIESGVTEDVWLKGAVVKPGNKKVLHHCLIFIEYPPELKHLEPNARGGLDGYFSGYVPGYRSAFFPEGTGKFLPKGSKFRFQMHYSSTGKKEQDKTELGLYFLKEKPSLELHSRAASNRRFRIPPNTPDFEITSEYKLAQDSLIYELSPHMHFRGSRFKYEALYPDGRKETILSVPNYDFNWQTHYRFAEPLSMPAGTKILCTGAFDNSVQNPFNPDPTKTVFFGEQTYEEMFIGYIEYAEKNGSSLSQK